MKSPEPSIIIRVSLKGVESPVPTFDLFLITNSAIFHADGMLASEQKDCKRSSFMAYIIKSAESLYLRAKIYIKDVDSRQASWSGLKALHKSRK